MPHPIERVIRDVPDFPKPGIVFKDLTPVFGDSEAFQLAMRDLDALVDWTGISHVAAVEARGFILGGYVAARRPVGFIPIRKPGKLPADTLTEKYALEYGTDALQIHRDACASASGVLVLDDLLATGGTAKAAATLIERAGGTVAGLAFLVELGFLEGRKILNGYDIASLVRF